MRYASDTTRRPPCRSGPGVGAGVEQAQVGPAGGQDGVDLVGGGQAAAGHGRDAGVVADQVAPADQVEAAVVGSGDGGGLAGGHLDEVAAVGGKGPGGGHRLLGRKAARCPVGDGQGRPQGPVVGPGGPDGVDHPQGEAQPALERPAEVVLAPVGQRGQEPAEQVAVGQVAHQHLDPGAGGAAGGGRELARDPIQVAGVGRLRHGAGGRVRDGRGGQERPAAVGQRPVDPGAAGSGGSAAAGVAEPQGQRRPVGGQLPGGLGPRPAWSSAHSPGVPGVTRPSGATATSSLTTTPAPAAAAAASRPAAAPASRPSLASSSAPAASATRLARVRAGWPSGVNSGGGATSVSSRPAKRRSTVAANPGSRPGQLQVADAAGAGQQVAGELDRVEAVVAADVLEPGGAVAGRLLEALDHRLALQLVVGEGRLQGRRVALEGLAEGDRVLHGQLGARPDGEVGGVGGVAEQDDVAVVPAPAADGDEADPQRPVGQQLVAVQLGGEQVLAERDALGLAGLVEPGRPPGGLGALDDEGAGVGVEGVGVDLEHAVLGGAEDEGEGVKGQVAAEPDELGAVHVLGRAQVRGEQPPGGRVDPVGGYHQVAVGEGVQVGRRPLEGQLDPDLAAAALEDLQQPPAGDGREPVPAGADRPAAVDHVDGAPAGEGVGDLHIAGASGSTRPMRSPGRAQHPHANFGSGVVFSEETLGRCATRLAS